jgi:hypothetical protein
MRIATKFVFFCASVTGTAITATSASAQSADPENKDAPPTPPQALPAPTSDQDPAPPVAEPAVALPPGGVVEQAVWSSKQASVGRWAMGVPVFWSSVALPAS